MNRLWRNNGLTIVLIAVFALTWLGQYVAGWRVLVTDQQSHGQPAMSFLGYARSGHFWQATGENWESEFLQMAMFVRAEFAQTAKPSRAHHRETPV